MYTRITGILKVLKDKDGAPSVATTQVVHTAVIILIYIHNTHTCCVDDVTTKSSAGSLAFGCFAMLRYNFILEWRGYAIQA